MKNTALIILFVFFIIPTGLSQDFNSIDSIVASYPSRSQTVKRLSKRINSSFKSDLEKVRAFYTWVALNIRYDISESGKYNYTYIDEKDRLVKEIKQTKKLSKRVISKRKGVCEGYASSLHELCTSIGLESEIVLGNAKTSTRQIGNSKRYNHAWNIVTIDSTKYLFDVTWDAISANKANVSYFYFMADPVLFVKNHFPKKSAHQLMQNPIAQSTYASWPLYYLTSSSSEFEITSPLQGILSKDEDVKFTIKTLNDTPLNSVGYSIGKQYSTVMDFVSENENNINFEIKKEKLTNSKLTIFINRNVIASYKLE